MIVALSALAAGCSRVIVADLAQPKLDLIGAVAGIETVNIRRRPLAEAVAEATDGWGADVVFEASGAAQAILGLPGLVRPGGTVVLVGSGKIDLRPLISATYPFAQAVEAFDRAVEARPTDVKLQIKI